MPMVWHQAVRKNCDVVFGESRGNKVLECNVIIIALEKARFFGTSVDYVENKSRGADPGTSGHDHAVGNEDAYRQLTPDPITFPK